MSDEEDDAGSGLLADERWLWVQVGKCFPKPAHLIAHTQPGNLFGAVRGSFLLSVLMIRTTASGWRGAVPRSYAWQGYRCADTGRCRLGTDSCQLPYLPRSTCPKQAQAAAVTTACGGMHMLRSSAALVQLLEWQLFFGNALASISCQWCHQI